MFKRQHLCTFLMSKCSKRTLNKFVNLWASFQRKQNVRLCFFFECKKIRFDGEIIATFKTFRRFDSVKLVQQKVLILGAIFSS